MDGSYLYPSEETIFSLIHPAEAQLVNSIRLELETSIPATTNLACPLALGGHVDHQLTRTAAEASGRSLWYYADYPYILQVDLEQEFNQAGLQAAVFPVSEQGVAAWQESVAAHASQISTFWPDLASMQTAIRAYHLRMGGVRLWGTP